MFNTIKNALKTPDVRKRLWYTLLLIIIFSRFVCTACIFAAALCMLGAGLVFRIADKNVEPKGVQKDE